MEQLPLNFDSPNGNIVTPATVARQRNTHTLVVKVMNSPFSFDEDFVVGHSKYHFRMSSGFKNGTYKLDEKNKKINYLSFAIKDGETEYRFEVGIANYSLISGDIDRKKLKDETLGDSIGNIQISSIRKVDKHGGGPRYTDKHGEYIRSFDYFRRLFGYGISDKLMPILGRVILKIISQQGQ